MGREAPAGSPLFVPLLPVRLPARIPSAAAPASECPSPFGSLSPSDLSGKAGPTRFLPGNIVSAGCIFRTAGWNRILPFGYHGKGGWGTVPARFRCLPRRHRGMDVEIGRAHAGLHGQGQTSSGAGEAVPDWATFRCSRPPGPVLYVPSVPASGRSVPPAEDPFLLPGSHPSRRQRSRIHVPSPAASARPPRRPPPQP